MRFQQDGNWHSISTFTGPQSLQLSLQLNTNDAKKSSVVSLEPLGPNSDIPNEAQVIRAVLKGASLANERYGTACYPNEIRCAVESHQPEGIICRGAYCIVERIALPNFAHQLQVSINSSELSFHKLSAATKVSKAVLTSVAESGSLEEIDRLVVNRLLEYFGIVDPLDSQ